METTRAPEARAKAEGPSVSPEHAMRVVEEVTRRATQAMPLEVLLTSPHGFGLVGATPLQRAICRLADGLPLGDLALHPDVLECIGDVSELDGRPDELDILSGTRTAKSMITAALAVRATQTCDVAHLAKGEVPRYAIVSVRKDLADVIFGHIKGTLLAQPTLRTLLLEDPTADTVVLKHPSGRPVEIKVVAGAKAGTTLVARWLVGLALDEYTRMVGSEDGVVNYDDMRRAVLSRLLPGAMVASIGSPWAPFGPAFDRAQKHWLKPTKKLVFIWATADRMNPAWWTPERSKELQESDPDAYMTDCLAQFLEPEELFFPASLVEQSARKEPEILPREPGYVYSAAMDPATRSNAWTLVIGTRKDERRIVARAHQWKPHGKPLDPKAVFAEMAIMCRAYGVTMVRTDQWSVDALRALAELAGLTLVQQDFGTGEQYDAYKTAQTWLTLGQLELAPVLELLTDLKRVKRRVTQSGLSIVLPHTADGRHCDFAPALVRLLGALHEDYAQPKPERGTQERAELEAKLMEEREEAQFSRGQRERKRHWFASEVGR